MSMPPCADAMTTFMPDARSSVMREVELLVDVERFLDQDLAHDAAPRGRSGA